MSRMFVALVAFLFAAPVTAKPIGPAHPIKIAVIDSGIAKTPLLAPLVVAEYDMAGVFENRPAFQPAHDHGTEVATVIAREARAPIQIYSLRIDTPGECTDRSSGCSFLDTNMIAAIDKAVDLGVDVINLSTGGSPTPEMQAAIRRASAHGIKIAIAAGNQRGEPPYKALARAGGKNVWLVGAMDGNDRPASFSARPRDPDTADYQFAWRLGLRVKTQNMEGKWVSVSGTSLATPILTAEIASLIAQKRK